MTEKTGNKLSQTVEKEWEQVEAALQQFEQRIGIGGLAATDLDDWLTLDVKQLDKISAEECANASLLLSQEATYIQSQLNSLQSKMDWCKRRIDRIIAPILRQSTRYMDADCKRSLAITQDDVAEKLNSVYNETASYHARLTYLPNSLRAQADKFTKLQDIKRSQEYNG